MWDFAGLGEALLGLMRDAFKWFSADEEAKRLDNREKKDRFEAEKEARSFSARMRRFLANRKFIFLVVLLVFACARVQPLEVQEREAWENCQKENEELRMYLQEALDNIERLQKCDASMGIDEEIDIWLASGCR